MMIPQPMPYPSLANDNLLDVLRLIRTLNVGPVTFFHLIQRFGTAAKALEALPDLARRGGRRSPLSPCPEEQAFKEMEAIVAFGARPILYGAPDYPRLLLNINDPPPFITALGHMALWEKDCVALVGARNASANGCQFGQKLARELGEAGLTVVSGLARGIDAFVHKGSLGTGTVGVIAGGIDTIYPPENGPLYAQIRESGAIVSEQPFGMAPFSGSFPGRNRIIAGMSLGTVVVEASLKSGSLITARLAAEYGRELFAVPGTPLDPRSKGCNHLLREGAHMAESAGDILQGLNPLRNTPLAERVRAPYMAEAAETMVPEAELARARKILLDKIGPSAVAIDELIEQCETSAPVVLTILLELELAGRLKRTAGNKVYLSDIVVEAVA